MSATKVRAQARRHAYGYEVPIESLTPENMQKRVQSAYIAGHAAGRTYQRQFSKKQSARGNIDHADEE